MSLIETLIVIILSPIALLALYTAGLIIVSIIKVVIGR